MLLSLTNSLFFILAFNTSSLTESSYKILMCNESVTLWLPLIIFMSEGKFILIEYLVK